MGYSWNLVCRRRRRCFWGILWVVWAAAGVGFGGCQEEQQERSFLISSFSRPETWLRPYDWNYLRVEVPPWFSSLVMIFVSNVDIDKENVKQVPKSRLPVICFKAGSPPIPDISDSYLEHLLSEFSINGSFGGSEHNVEQCIPFQKNLTVTLTNEQISPGVWYIGVFNGLGPARTQSKMISRGHAYMFSTNINIRGCSTSTMWGPYCNQTIDIISCSQSSTYIHSRSLLDMKMYHSRGNSDYIWRGQGHLGSSYHLLSKLIPFDKKQATLNSSIFAATENLITCNNSIESSCLGYGKFSFYFLDIEGMASQFTVTATAFKFNQTYPTNKSADFGGVILMCYARYNAMPLVTSHDHFADISAAPLVVKSPKIGRWYIAFQVVNQTKGNNASQETYSDANFCFSFEWQVHECLNGKAGLNCTWEAQMLQRVPRKGSGVPSESYYLPIDDNAPLEHANFPLGPLLSNSSIDNTTWTFFFLDVPPGAAGANMHVQLISDTKVNYEIYAKFGGIASSDTWDYFVNSTSRSNGSMFLASNDTSQQGKIDFYILYAQEGIWCFGLKYPPSTHDNGQTTMSIALEGCPEHCSSYGSCHSSVDGSGLTFYSYCACDRDHGGFDCSSELVSHEGHVWQSIFLIASNVAAILPAFWSLRQKAFSEWVLFTSSGISSGLYHACDVGTWCVLSFHVLQFLDFWLSFMAVVSTFVYMTAIDEASKRAIHTVVAIITALLAVSGATRSTNIVVVIAIGTLGLLVGWLLEFSTACRSLYCPPAFDLNMPERWQNVMQWFWNLMKTLHKRFHWPFVFLGFVALAFAATSWKLESNESYWIWHSLWHITIYTSSFFFLCSTSVKSSSQPRPAEYELTRQDSLPRTQ